MGLARAEWRSLLARLGYSLVPKPMIQPRFHRIFLKICPGACQTKSFVATIDNREQGWLHIPQ
ncbi:MAG TPA: hypothetical protein DEG17_15030 [Cyanobacteria bacterium UBA11149]|nr:hypothetical protein [Cyanobacteria bacterium UBA11367]HBE56621.1 hypothetical protein [Cyanobacteria bacterium UBA11366]HBK65808.1 hypothetical protein [Cyanobacteria bacterium UBA11166]HBR76695.1 hypothetical protein [Cyanobacteria bacterium UBA11159]HBS72222.1 hypothetical protein [Cyanobacteria bacterium UBA11153]HBW90147.1 hypothetical protein [Cyanobacteria bacterium UBA11149]HCA94336.1 hypothetical protein [Cyanobacteria bacterium UBA9226]